MNFPRNETIPANREPMWFSNYPVSSEMISLTRMDIQILIQVGGNPVQQQEQKFLSYRFLTK